MSDFPQLNQNVEEFNDSEITDMSLRDCAEIDEKQYRSLNEKQKAIVDNVLQLISNEIIEPQTTQSTYDNCMYINGIGGSGKTFIYSTLYYLLKAKNICMMSMAFTGIASILLPKGKTVHKTFHLPVPLHSDSTSNLKMQSKDAQNIKNAKLIVWDEALMAPRYALEIIDMTLKELMNNELPFGGKIIILGGDDRQLLPVLPSATRNEIINISLKSSHLWKYFRKFTLSQNMRIEPDEIEFCQFVKDIGDGLLNDENNNVEVPVECIAPEASNIVDEIYGEIIRKKNSMNWPVAQF